MNPRQYETTPPSGEGEVSDIAFVQEAIDRQEFEATAFRIFQQRPRGDVIGEDEVSDVTFSQETVDRQEFKTTAFRLFRDGVDTRLLDDEETVRFNICPNSVFSFSNASMSNDTALPLVLETPFRNSIVISCISSALAINGNCTFTGGDTHLLINNDDTLDLQQLFPSSDDSVPAESSGKYPLTITGITFQRASQISVLMNDPRCSVHFNECHWKDNTGEAIVVNGTYTKPEEVLTTTSSTVDWSMIGEDDDNLGDIDDAIPMRLLLNAENAEGRSTEEEEHEGALIGHSVAVVEDHNRAELPYKQDQVKVEEEEEGDLVSKMEASAFNWGSHELPLINDQEDRLVAIPKEVDKEGKEGLNNLKAGEVRLGRARIPRMLDENNIEEPRAIVSIEKSSFSVREQVILFNSY